MRNVAELLKKIQTLIEEHKATECIPIARTRQNLETPQIVKQKQQRVQPSVKGIRSENLLPNTNPGGGNDGGVVDPSESLETSQNNVAPQIPSETSQNNVAPQISSETSQNKTQQLASGVTLEKKYFSSDPQNSEIPHSEMVNLEDLSDYLDVEKQISVTSNKIPEPPTQKPPPPPSEITGTESVPTGMSTEMKVVSLDGIHKW